MIRVLARKKTWNRDIKRVKFDNLLDLALKHHYLECEQDLWE